MEPQPRFKSSNQTVRIYRIHLKIQTTDWDGVGAVRHTINLSNEFDKPSVISDIRLTYMDSVFTVNTLVWQLMLGDKAPSGTANPILTPAMEHSSIANSDTTIFFDIIQSNAATISSIQKKISGSFQIDPNSILWFIIQTIDGTIPTQETIFDFGISFVQNF